MTHAYELLSDTFTLAKALEGQAKPIKMWTRGVPVDDGSRQQLLNTASLPFIYKWLAVMPDVHFGKGSTIGSVIPTKGAIIPAAVGVDLGCGMMAVRTSLEASQLPDSLSALRSAVEAAVPHGGVGVKGGWRNHVPSTVSTRFEKTGLGERLERIISKHPKLGEANSLVHLGTLGSGNHFIEVCLDEADRVWVMLHSGSRGIGNRIGT
jgi:tRNA-splicing ligase RtcB (3'-phosphate/5'-hydroxy nucleic acid ligase)